MVYSVIVMCGSLLLIKYRAHNDMQEITISYRLSAISLIHLCLSVFICG